MPLWFLPLSSTVFSPDTVKKVRLVAINDQFKIKFSKTKFYVFPFNTHRSKDVFHVTVFKFNSQDEINYFFERCYN